MPTNLVGEWFYRNAMTVMPAELTEPTAAAEGRSVSPVHPTGHDWKGPFCNLVRLWRKSRDEQNEAVLRRFGPPDETGHVEMPLACMLPGDDGHVLGLKGDPEVRQHLLEMGFTAGTPVVFVRVAPLGDPLTVRVRGYQLSLRHKEAEAIWMRRCPPGGELPIDWRPAPEAARTTV